LFPKNNKSKTKYSKVRPRTIFEIKQIQIELRNLQKTIIKLKSANLITSL